MLPTIDMIPEIEVNEDLRVHYLTKGPREGKTIVTYKQHAYVKSTCNLLAEDSEFQKVLSYFSLWFEFLCNEIKEHHGEFQVVDKTLIFRPNVFEFCHTFAIKVIIEVDAQCH